jgi:hypothetical protein
MYHSHHAGRALHFLLKMVNMRLDRKAFLAVVPLLAATTFFAFRGWAFAQNARQVESPGEDTAADTADLPLLLDARMALHHGMQADHDVRQYLAKHPSSADAHYLLGFILFREIQERATDQNKGQVNFKPDAVKASLAEYTEGAKYRTPSYLDLKVVALDYVLLEDYADADKWLSRSLEWNPQDAESWMISAVSSTMKPVSPRPSRHLTAVSNLTLETSRRKITWV